MIITVSLGDAPVTDDQPSGDWGFYNDWDREYTRRKRKKKEAEELEATEREIQDATDREIASLLHRQQKLDDDKRELVRLQSLVSRYDSVDSGSDRVNEALEMAKKKQTMATFEKLQREVARQLEEEEFLLMLLLNG